MRGSSPCEELARGSPRAANRRQGRSSGRRQWRRGTGARVGEEGRSGTGARGEGEQAAGADKDARNKDRWHVARGWPAAATRAARCGAPRAKQREESERLIGGPGVGFLFSFLFFFLWAVTNGLDKN